jgi:hypothetical protein
MSISNITPMIEVPFICSKHVAAYLGNKYGEKLYINKNFLFKDQIFLCLNFKKYYNKITGLENKVHITLLITESEANKYGRVLNGAQNNMLNSYIDSYLKNNMVTFLDAYLMNKKDLKGGIESFYNWIGLEDEVWSTDAIKRYYHRVRAERGDTMLRP